MELIFNKSFTIRHKDLPELYKELRARGFILTGKIGCGGTYCWTSQRYRHVDTNAVIYLRWVNRRCLITY